MIWHGKNFRGFLNKASQVLFNKTGTTLNSTNVQDAICEINSNLSGLIGVTFEKPVQSTAVNFDYPTGFTKDNCVPVAVLVNAGIERIDTRYGYVVDLGLSQIQITPLSWDQQFYVKIVLLKIVN